MSESQSRNRAELPDVKVLLVDDLEENLFACEQMLRRDGLELITALSGAAALDALRVHDFALAIVDVQMPEMDGFELAEVMRSTERTRHVPIIFVTASMREPRGMFRGYEAGAFDFLYKPIEPVMLRNKAETFFELHRQRQLLAQQVDMLRDQQLDTRRAKDVAEAANRAKDEFLANVTHEIRTPMNAILGLTELVLDGQLTEGQRQSLRTVWSAAGHLLGMINDILDYSKIGAGKLELDRAPFALREGFGETMRALAVRAHRKGLELVCDIDPEVPDVLIGDVGRFRQVVINLVGNAIKFTDHGEVVFEIGLALPSADRGRVGLRCAVRDTGIGISRDKQAAIFHAFEQEDTSTTRRYGGTGLGLTIAAQLIALMDGQLDVESDVGAGSAFTFTAWLGRQDTSREATLPPLAGTLRGMRTLLVERNAACRRALERWLRHWDLDVTSVDTAHAAATAFAARPYELVILDAKVPMFEVEARTILLTTDGQPERTADARVQKPVMPAELLHAIRGVMNGVRYTAGTRAARPAYPAPPLQIAVPLRILVAEDNDYNSQLMRQLLATRGYEVRVATTGRDALDLASKQIYDVLLLDIHMPELDGFQVARAIRERERGTTRRLPIIAVTARSRDSDRERCIDSGMDDFIVKPIRSQSLWDSIERLVRPAR